MDSLSMILKCILERETHCCRGQPSPLTTAEHSMMFLLHTKSCMAEGVIYQTYRGSRSVVQCHGIIVVLYLPRFLPELGTDEGRASPVKVDTGGEPSPLDGESAPWLVKYDSTTPSQLNRFIVGCAYLQLPKLLAAPDCQEFEVSRQIMGLDAPLVECPAKSRIIIAQSYY